MNKIIIFFVAVFLNASVINDFLNKNYGKVCSYKNYIAYIKNPKILSIIGKACLEVDRIYLLPYIVTKLKKGPLIRKNAIYFLTVVMEKRVIYSFLFDGLKLDAFSFPKVDYVLSDIFWALKNKEYKKVGGVYIIKINTKTYKLYKKFNKMMLDEYIDNKLIKRRWYR